MPNYDYKCKKCSHSFEIFQPMTSPLIKKCPKCGGAVKRLIGTGAGFIFKGPGFYATDYKKPEKKTEKKESADKKIPDECKSCKDNTCGLKKGDN